MSSMQSNEDGTLTSAEVFELLNKSPKNPPKKISQKNPPKKSSQKNPHKKISSQKNILPKHFFQKIPPKKSFQKNPPKIFQKNSQKYSKIFQNISQKSLHRTWRPKTLSGLF